MLGNRKMLLKLSKPAIANLLKHKFEEITLLTEVINNLTEQLEEKDRRMETLERELQNNWVCEHCGDDEQNLVCSSCLIAPGTGADHK